MTVDCKEQVYYKRVMKMRQTKLNNKSDQKITIRYKSRNVWTVERFLYKFIDRIYHNQHWYIGLLGGLCQDIVPRHASSYQASHKTINNLKMIKCFNKNIEKILYNFDIKDLIHRNVIHIWPESQVKVLWVTKHHRYRLLGEIY